MEDAARKPNWSAYEIELVVADYFEMWVQDQADIRCNRKASFNKSARYRALNAIIGRTVKSIERKHQNISAVFQRIGLPYIRGLVPLDNLQADLAEAVIKKVEQTEGFQALLAPLQHDSDSTLITVPAPEKSVRGDRKNVRDVNRLIQKFDPAARDDRNQELGHQGERLVFETERKRLDERNLGELADRVRWISRDDGDGAGFDIRSFDVQGNERLIEVKTTRGGPQTPFFLSENERRMSQERAHCYHLLRLYNFGIEAMAFELRPPLNEAVYLEATNYWASFT